MRALSGSELLGLWETGASLHPLDQGVLALEAALPGAGRVADWPMGRRNRALAELRCALFGPALRGWTGCRECGAQLEFDLDASVMAETSAAEAGDHVAVGQRNYRLPTSRDLAAIVGETDSGLAARRLLARCRAGDDMADASIGEDEVEAVGEAMAAADSLAEVLLRFDCPACGAAYDEPFDLAAFLWAELEARARTALWEVHRLARAYGWSEVEILALSPTRRRAYLEMVGG
jgi:hypothetical protein